MTFRRSRLPRTIAAIAAWALVGAGLFVAISASAASQSVTVKNFAFAPATINVNVGDSITWTNQDSTAHTVTANDGTSFDKPLSANGGSATITFNTAGTFAYHCSIHPNMHGTVIVAAASTGSSATQAPTSRSGATATAAAPSTGSGASAGASGEPLLIIVGGLLACLGLGAGLLAVQRR